MQLSTAAPAGTGDVTWEFPWGCCTVLDVYCWDCSLLQCLKAKCRRGKQGNIQESHRDSQSESSRKLRACCSISSATCQVQLWSVWSLQIKEQGSACHTLTASKLKKSLYKMNLYFSRFGQVFHLAVLLARGELRCGWALCLLKPRERDRKVKHSSFINRAQQGRAGWLCLPVPACAVPLLSEQGSLSPGLLIQHLLKTVNSL